MALLAKVLVLKPQIVSVDVRGCQVSERALNIARKHNPGIDALLAVPRLDLSLEPDLRKGAAGHQDHIICLAQMDNGLIASGSRDKTVRIWNQKGQLVVRCWP